MLAAGVGRAYIPPLNPDGTVPSLAPLLEQITPSVVNIAVRSGSPARSTSAVR